MSKITVNVNGISITASGNNITVKNWKVFVDGRDVTPDAKEVYISVNGSVDKLSVDACNDFNIDGDVGSLNTQSGDVTVTGNVKGNIQTMSGNVDCFSIGGSVSTMSGNIKTNK